MCPIETPEGPEHRSDTNSLATYARINQYGFVEAPYRWIDKSDPENPVVTEKVVYMTATKKTIIMWHRRIHRLMKKATLFIKNVSGRYREETQEYERSKFDYMDVSPKMVFSVATALIPFP